MQNDLMQLRVLVTRPKPQGYELCAQIESHHGRPCYFPVIQFAPLHDTMAFQEAIAQLNKQDWLIFISPQAVAASLPAIKQRWPAFPANVKVAAVGVGTAQMLKQAGFTVCAYPKETWGSEGLLDLPSFQSVSGSKIAIIRGEGGRDFLEKKLAEKEAIVLPIIAYLRTLPPKESIPPDLFQKSMDAIVCTSFEGVKNLLTLAGKKNEKKLFATTLVVISERMKMLAEDLGFQTIWVAKNASHQEIIATLTVLAVKMTNDSEKE